MATNLKNKLFKLLDKDPHCHYCRKRLDRDTATLDHVIPRSRGGTHCWSNLVLACGPCNRYKADLTKEEFQKLKADRLGVNPKPVKNSESYFGVA